MQEKKKTSRGGRPPIDPEGAEQQFCKNFKNWINKNYYRREAEVAKILGISYQQMNNVKHGRRVGSETWRRWVADQLGLDYEEMVGAKKTTRPVITTQDITLNLVAPSEEAVPEETENYRYIPIYEDEVLVFWGEGFDFGRQKKPTSALVVNKEDVRSRVDHDLRGIRVTDDAMWPRVPQGSILIVDLSDKKFIEGKIYVVSNPETSPPRPVVRTAREINQKQLRGYILECENQRYLPQITDDNWEELVVGRVVWIWRGIEGPQIDSQFQQPARRVDSVDWLAGGLAHDLNNLLYPILGYCEMIVSNTEEEETRESAAQVIEAGRQARALTRQLLAFSRQKIQEFVPVDVNEMIRSLEHLVLRSLLNDEVTLRVSLTSPIPTTNADQDQLEQVLVSLVNNAQDAMPEGGDLTIETDRVDFDEKSLEGWPGMSPGRYVYLSVRDTGPGMDKETLEYIFDPFFTTKEDGNYSGLGLSIAYGIIKQHGGTIWADSRPGEGTRVKIYLPATPASPKTEEFEVKESLADTGDRTNILLVEDSRTVRRLCSKMLKNLGYNVLEAEDGKEALDAINSTGDRIHLMLTDVVLPDINGRELYEQVFGQQPKTKVLYMSAYPKNVIVHHKILPEDVDFIPKPFSKEEISKKIQEVLHK